MPPGKKLGQRRVFSDFNLLLFYVWFYYEPPPLSLSLLQFPGIAETCRRPIDRIENCKAGDAIVPQGYQSGRSFFFVFIAYCEQIIIDGTITVVTSGSRSESRALLLSSIIVRAQVRSVSVCVSLCVFAFTGSSPVTALPFALCCI